MFSFDTLGSTWQELSGYELSTIRDSRLQLHWAAILVSSIGASLAEPDEAEYALALQWLPEDALLAGTVIGGETPFRAAFTPSDLIIHLLDEHNGSTAAYSIDGTSFKRVLAWYKDAIEDLTGEDLEASLAPPAIPLPEHPIGNGEPFNAESPWDLAELSRWFGSADALLKLIAKQWPGADGPWVWPKRFDIALLLPVEGPPSASGEPRTIEVGMCPGDAAFEQPYWYVNIHPQPTALPDEPPTGGQWYAGRWSGAVLLGSELVKAGSSAAQLAKVAAFLNAAIPQCRALAASVT